jgi:hypothetical protein
MKIGLMMFPKIKTATLLIGLMSGMLPISDIWVEDEGKDEDIASADRSTNETSIVNLTTAA